jgi:hypothetical protein
MILTGGDRPAYLLNSERLERLGYCLMARVIRDARIGV